MRILRLCRQLPGHERGWKVCKRGNCGDTDTSRADQSQPPLRCTGLWIQCPPLYSYPSTTSPRKKVQESDWNVSTTLFPSPIEFFCFYFQFLIFNKRNQIQHVKNWDLRDLSEIVRKGSFIRIPGNLFCWLIWWLIRVWDFPAEKKNSSFHQFLSSLEGNKVACPHGLQNKKSSIQSPPDIYPKIPPTNKGDKGRANLTQSRLAIHFLCNS